MPLNEWRWRKKANRVTDEWREGNSGTKLEKNEKLWKVVKAKEVLAEQPNIWDARMYEDPQITQHISLIRI
jgi:hypothetical protein